MSTPTIQNATDDTKLYAGHDARSEAGHAVPNPQHGEGPHMDLEPIGTGKVILFVAGFLILFAVLFLLGLWPTLRDRKLAEAESESAGNAAIIVNVISPKPPTKLPMLEVPGDAQAYQVTSLYPRTNGYLKRRLVDIGDQVKEGQLLAEIDAPEVDAQLAGAQATLLQAKSAAAKAKDDFDLAEATFQRYESFFKTGGVTQQSLDEKRSAYTSAKAVFAGSEANVKADEAEVQRLQSLVGFTKITAPFSGTITTRGYDVGALLSANNTSVRELFQIAQTDTLRVFVDIPQSYATYLKVGQEVKFLVTNYPGHPFTGYVARLSGAINQQTRTMRIEADFPNPDGKLYPGMYGTLRYEVNEQSPKLIIPSSALVFGPEGLRVGVVDPSNKVRFQAISVGSDLGAEVEITHGLTKDDRIVANPGERLADGVEVQIAQANAPKAPDATNAKPAGNTEQQKSTPVRTAEANAR